LNSFKEKYVYLDIRDTCCGPWVGERPALEEVENKYGVKVSFVSISIDRPIDTENWKNFIKTKELGCT